MWATSAGKEIVSWSSSHPVGENTKEGYKLRVSGYEKIKKVASKEIKYKEKKCKKNNGLRNIIISKFT